MSKVLIIGGRGALGNVILSHLKTKNYWVASVDMVKNDAADENILITSTQDWQEQSSQLETAVAAALGGASLDGIFCVAGGWAGGNAAAEDFVKNCDLMWRQSVWSSVIAARLAAKHLKAGGVLQLTGAQPALKGTPGMMGYGMAKAAVQHLTRSLACPGAGLADGVSVIAILPVTLDTPMNRKWMADADKSGWTPLSAVAELFADWLAEPAKRPPSGSLLQLITKDGETEFVFEN